MIHRPFPYFRIAVLVLALAIPAISRAEPERIEVGMYVVNLNELDMKTGTYQGDFYVWFRWTGKLSPAAFEVMNGSETTKERNFYSVTNGIKYAVYRCQSRLNRVFGFRTYPLDGHVLTIEIEDGQHDSTELIYVPDTGNTRVHPGLRLAGWGIGPSRALVQPYTYPTNYGDPATAPDYKATYSRFVMEVPISHRGAGVFLKAFLPLFISVAIALLSLFVAASELEVRVGLGVAGIFGAVSSQIVVAGALPETPDLTLSDQVHVLSLFFVFLALLTACLVFRLASTDREPRALALDRSLRILLPLGYVLSVAAVTLFR